jgi:hypothetical protein
MGKTRKNMCEMHVQADEAYHFLEEDKKCSGVICNGGDLSTRIYCLIALSWVSMYSPPAMQQEGL